MTNTKYRGFRIQDNSGRISIFPQNAQAYIAMSGGYGFNRKGVTFAATAVKSVSGAKKVVRELYDRNDKFMQQQAGLTRRAISGMGIVV